MTIVAIFIAPAALTVLIVLAAGVAGSNADRASDWTFRSLNLRQLARRVGDRRAGSRRADSRAVLDERRGPDDRRAQQRRSDPIVVDAASAPRELELS